METLTTVALLIIDDFGMRKLSVTATEDLLEIVMRRYECASTLLTFNAESIFMRTPHLMEGVRRHFAVFVVRILGLLQHLDQFVRCFEGPVRSFGAITDSRASNFTDGSARV